MFSERCHRTTVLSLWTIISFCLCFRNNPVLRRFHRLLHGHGTGGLVSTPVCRSAFPVGGRSSSGPAGQLRTRMGGLSELFLVTMSSAVFFMNHLTSLCLQTFAQRLYQEYTCYTVFFVSIEICQISDVLIRKTRRLSVFQQGFFRSSPAHHKLFKSLWEMQMICIQLYKITYS